MKTRLLFALALLTGSAGITMAQQPCSVTANINSNGSNTISGYASVGNGTMNPNATYYWNFGDGTSGSGIQFSHTYTANGTYSVCVTMMDSANNCSATNCDSVVIGQNSNTCSVSFTGIPDSTNYVYFDLTSTGVGPFTYSFDYGDGSTGAVNDHTYAQSGVYYACVTSTDANGCTSSFCDSVMVGSNPNPSNCQAYFYQYDNGNGSIDFYAGNNINNTTSFTWSFGDGTSGTGSYVSHQFTPGATYTVCVTMYDQQNNCSDTYCETITVSSGTPAGCDANFYMYPDSANGTTGNWYAVNMSSGNNLSYFWDFGDGTTSNLQYPSHTYAQQGMYVVCLTVVSNDSLQCTDSYCDSSAYFFRTASGMSHIEVIPNGTTGIRKSKESFISMLPNPASTMVALNFATETKGMVKVYDMIGNEVMSLRINGTSQQLNIEDLQAGVYNVVGTFEGYTLNKKLVVSK